MMDEMIDIYNQFMAGKPPDAEILICDYLPAYTDEGEPFMMESEFKGKRYFFMHRRIWLRVEALVPRDEETVLPQLPFPGIPVIDNPEYVNDILSRIFDQVHLELTGYSWLNLLHSSQASLSPSSKSAGPGDGIVDTPAR
jgi:hypothetical protein